MELPMWFDKIKDMWDNPRKIEEAEVYILFGVFMTLWMLMVIW